MSRALVPLRGREGGVLRRPGHTEASVDLCKAAAVPPGGLLCELVDPGREDGAIAARDACLKFAREHNIKVTTIDMLRAWQAEHDA